MWATVRHATSRAGDPMPHDHVLVANVVEMHDAQGGWKAADTALLRHRVMDATRVGQAASAAKAEELGMPSCAPPRFAAALAARRGSRSGAGSALETAAQVRAAVDGRDLSYREERTVVRATGSGRSTSRQRCWSVDGGGAGASGLSPDRLAASIDLAEVGGNVKIQGAAKRAEVKAVAGEAKIRRDGAQLRPSLGPRVAAENVGVRLVASATSNVGPGSGTRRSWSGPRAPVKD